MTGRAIALLLAPVEATSSFLRGSELGPEALAAEIARLDTFDPEVGASLEALGPVEVVRAGRPGLTLEESIACLEAEASRLGSEGKFVMTLGGEHTVTLGPLRALLAAGEPFGLVQLDAHGDLRAAYEGQPLSHACVVRRASEDLGLPILGLGIRSMSAEEGEYLRRCPTAARLGPRAACDDAAVERALAALPEAVYLTVDMDVFDPSAAPGVGTPEAGGLDWPRVARLIDLVAGAKRVVGADVVELAPSVEHERTVRLGARVAVRVLLRSLGSGSRRPG